MTASLRDDSHGLRMLQGRTIAAVVPAYNEAGLIRATLDGAPAFVDMIIVVDDGSTDGTIESARPCKRDFELLAHRANFGVGAAIASGCKRALCRGAELVVVLAADGQMAPADLPALLRPLLDDQADFVKGDRLAWPMALRKMPVHRWAGNHALSWLTRWALGRRIDDSQCGYVALNSRALRKVRWDSLWKGYGYPNDLLSEVMAQGLRIREVPVRPVYGEERSGIRLHHALFVIPFVILRAWLRRKGRGAIEAPWPTSTSSTAMPTASAPSPSSAMPTRDKAR